MAPAVFNPYEVLGVGENATQEEIKAAFRKLSKERHPDTEGGDPQEFINVKKAYDILTNKEHRDTYDLYGVAIDFYEETKNLAFTIFLEVATGSPKGAPLDTEIKSYVTLALIPKFEAEMKALEEKRENLESHLSGMVRKPEDDFVSARARKVLDKYLQEYKMAMLRRDIHKAALKLLQEYKFDLAQIESADRLWESALNSATVWSWHLDGDGTGTGGKGAGK